MSNRYAQVVLSYWRDLWSSWMGPVLVFPGLLIIAAMMLHPPSVPDLRIFVETIGFVSFGAWYHFREQVICDRRRYWPGYLAPHVVIFAALALVLCVAVPGAIAWRAGARSVGLTACGAACFAVIGWWLATLSPVVFLVGFAAWLWVFASRDVLVQQFMAGQYEPLAWGVLATAIATMAVTVTRMSRMTQENRRYFWQRSPSRALSARPRMTGEGGGAWSERTASWFWPRRAYIPSGNSLWDRSRRWRSLKHNPWLILLALMGGLLLLLWYMVRLQFQAKNGLHMAFLWFFILPAPWAAMVWLQLWRYVDGDFLRPVDRASFLKEIGLAIAVEVAQCWLVAAAGLTAATYVFGPRPLNGPLLLRELVASVAMQGLAFGIAVWVMRYRAGAMALMPFIIPVVIMGTIVSGIPQEILPYVSHGSILWWITAAMLLLGICITRDAYRRWLVTELG